MVQQYDDVRRLKCSIPTISRQSVFVLCPVRRAQMFVRVTFFCILKINYKSQVVVTSDEVTEIDLSSWSGLKQDQVV